MSQKVEGLVKTIQSLKPTHKQAIITGVVLLTLATLGVAGYLIFQYVPVANQWMHSQVIPNLQSNIQIWQALAYIGSGSTAVVLATGLAIYLLQKKAENQKAKEFEYDGTTDDIYER